MQGTFWMDGWMDGCESLVKCHNPKEKWLIFANIDVKINML
jgi:hypothetical protein